MRFDFYGCGDSYGDYTQATLTRWIEDIHSAVCELKASDVTRIYIIGLRLGATLATLYGAQSQDIEGVLLWDPVSSGRNYIQELKAKHRQWLQGSFAYPSSLADESMALETCGFALSHQLVHEFHHLDLEKLKTRPAREVLIIQSKDSPCRNEIYSTLIKLNASVTCNRVSDSKVWEKASTHSSKGFVPKKTIELIMAWLSQRLV